MTRFNIRKRDGLARTSIFQTDSISLKLPTALEVESLFPDIDKRDGTNLPLYAPLALVKDYPPLNNGQPVSIHPLLDNSAHSGDCVMVENWHTAFLNPRNYVDWLISLKEKTPADTVWYAPASVLPSNVHILCYSGFDLFDFRAVDLKTAQMRFCLPEGEFPVDVLDSGICTCSGCRTKNLKLHNRQALLDEIALVSWFIEQSQLRDLVESRCRLNSEQVSIIRYLDNQYHFMERYIPVARSGIMRANSGESLRRIEVRRFADRVINRYLPPKTDVAVLLPCSAKKPYTLSQSHRKFGQTIARRAHELIVTSPLGLVPREIECIYPAGHYDVPVTGYWDAEECAVIADILTRYFERHKYRRIIAHLEGGALRVAQIAAEACGITLEYSCREHPTSDSALKALDSILAGERRIKDDMLRGMVSYQFNIDLDTKGISVRGHYPELFYSKNNVQIFSIDTGTGLLRPTFDGWNLIPEGYRVYIDDFIPEGDVLVPGLVKADPGIREGDEVLVVGARAHATGRAALSAGEMLHSRRGIAVRVRKIMKV